MAINRTSPCARTVSAINVYAVAESTLMSGTQCIVFSFTAACFASGALGHEVELLVGRSAAGQIKVHAELTHAIELAPSIFPGITGHAFAEPAFHSTILEEPSEDFFLLSSSSDLRFMLLAKDPGMEVWNDTGSAFLPVGGTYFIGAPVFDTHPMWNIIGGTPGNHYSLTLKLFDTSGIHSESEPLTLTFTPVPEPGALALFLLGAIGFRWRSCQL
jgi:hypothetical protein